MKKILIIDDEKDICILLEKFLSKQGFETKSFNNGTNSTEWLKSNHVDLVICDFKLPDYNGLEMLQKIKIINNKTQVIIITGYSDVKIAVQALKKGAYDYVTKPLYPDEILNTVKMALASEVSEEKPKKSSSSSGKEFNDKKIIEGTSQQSVTIKKHVDLIAPTDMTVIVLGETGTGKEYVAKSIHKKSKRRNRPFVAVDCGALPENLASSELFGHIKGAFTGAVNDRKGHFELANGGTLFLDEIGNLTYENQIKLLRVLQERKITPVGGTKDIAVDVRMVVATNESLIEFVKSDQFREDLYHRLNEFKIELSPLRERPDDIEIFAQHFLDEANAQLDKEIKGFEEEALKKLKSYYWHGNLRELRNMVKRATLLCPGDLIDKTVFPDEIIEPKNDATSSLEISFKGQMPTDLKSVVEVAEKAAIETVLARVDNNKSKAAELLGIDRKTLYNKLNAYHIDLK